MEHIYEISENTILTIKPEENTTNSQEDNGAKKIKKPRIKKDLSKISEKDTEALVLNETIGDKINYEVSKNKDTQEEKEKGSIKLIEKFDEAKLWYIYDNYEKLISEIEKDKEGQINDFDDDNEENDKNQDQIWIDNQKKMIKRYLDKSVRGNIEIEYYQPSNKGRYYVKDGIGMQAMSRKIRHTISNDFVIDIDVVNASPCILMNLLNIINRDLQPKDKIHFPYLTQYCEKRDECFKQLEKEGLNKTKVKELIISIIFGKNIVKRGKKKKDSIEYPDFIKNFNREIQDIIEFLIKQKKDLYDEAVKDVNKIYENKIELKKKELGDKFTPDEEKKIYKKNPVGRFMSVYLIFDIENTILQNINKLLSLKNIYVSLLQFDGNCINKKDAVVGLTEECKEWIKKEMNYEISFAYKNLDEVFNIDESELVKYKQKVIDRWIVDYDKFEKLIKNMDNDIIKKNENINIIVDSIINIADHNKWVNKTKDDLIHMLMKKNKEYYDKKETNEYIKNKKTTNILRYLHTIEKLIKTNEEEKKKKQEENGEESDLTLDEIQTIDEIEMLKKDFSAAQLIKIKSEGRFVVVLEKVDEKYEKTLYCFNDFYKTDDQHKPMNRWYPDESILRNWISLILYNELNNKFKLFKHKISEKKVKYLNDIFGKLLEGDYKKKIVSACKDILWNESLKFNTNELLFGFTDCIYELNTGVFREYTKDDYITTNCGWAWYNDDNSEETEIKKDTVKELIKSIFPNKENMKSYLDILCAGLDGYAYQYMCFFKGEGSNSKSMLNNWIYDMLGIYAYKLSPTSIYDQTMSSSGPDPAIAGLDMKRFVYFSEPNREKKIDNSVFKELTGSGVLNKRNLHSSKCKTTLSCMIICELNNYLKFKSLVGYAEERRIICVPFTVQFVDEKDPRISENPSIFKAKKDIYAEKTFQNQHKKAFMSILFEHYLDFFKRERNIYVSQDCKIEKDKYLSLNVTIKKWFFDNYKIMDNKFEVRKMKNEKGQEYERQCLIYEEIGNKDSGIGIHYKFCNSETYKNLLNAEDKVEYSNHLHFINYLKKIPELKELYYEDKKVSIFGEKIYLRNVLVCIKEKSDNQSLIDDEVFEDWTP